MPDYVVQPKSIGADAKVDDGDAIPSAHCPGVYEAVLRKCATEDGRDPYFFLTSASDDPERAAAFKREQAERIEELVEERRGQPLFVQSHHLPDGLPAPFETFPAEGQRTVTVMPDDTVVLRPRPHNGHEVTR